MQIKIIQNVKTLIGQGVFIFDCGSLTVVYFNQHLSAAHSKCRSKYAFSTFCAKKLKNKEKARTLLINLAKKQFFVCTKTLFECYFFQNMLITRYLAVRLG